MHEYSGLDIYILIRAFVAKSVKGVKLTTWF